MVTMKCVCGISKMTFGSLTEKDFPDGWMNACCREIKTINGREVVEPAKTKGTVELWLDACGLRNKTRGGEWVQSTKCYEHYCTWMTRQGFHLQILNLTKFGREMRKICSTKRKSLGKVYLLEFDFTA